MNIHSLDLSKLKTKNEAKSKLKTAARDSQQIEGLFHLTSYRRNRSKYMILFVLNELALTGNKVGGDISFALVNTPVPVQTLRSRLVKWADWRYLSIVGGRYFITRKGRALINKLNKIIPSDVADWQRELIVWRSITSGRYMDAGGAWLPEGELIKVCESLRFHRPGSPRPTAGRPLTPAGKQRRAEVELTQLKIRAKCPKCGGQLWQQDDKINWYCSRCNEFHELG